MPIESVTLEHNSRGYTIPDTHYSKHPLDAVFFYGGWGSNFVGGPFAIRSDQPWGDGDKLAAYGWNYEAEYETVEHYFAASKATTEQDHDIIRTMRGPWDAKRAGRRTPLREDWEDVKYEVMLTALRVKFSESEYRTALLDTGDRLIAEDSPTDYVWGIRDRHHGYGGRNLLGKALMQVREELRQS